MAKRKADIKNVHLNLPKELFSDVPIDPHETIFANFTDDVSDSSIALHSTYDEATIDQFFNLTQVVKEKEDYDEFANFVLSILDDVS